MFKAQSMPIADFTSKQTSQNTRKFFILNIVSRIVSDLCFQFYRWYENMLALREISCIILCWLFISFHLLQFYLYNQIKHHNWRFSPWWIHGMPPMCPQGSRSFVLTYIFSNVAASGCTRSAILNRKSWIRHCCCTEEKTIQNNVIPWGERARASLHPLLYLHWRFSWPYAATLHLFELLL